MGNMNVGANQSAWMKPEINRPMPQKELAKTEEKNKGTIDDYYKPPKEIADRKGDHIKGQAPGPRLFWPS